MANTDEPEPPEINPRSRSKRILKWGSGAAIAFLAFAPPGTMIVIFLLASRVLGASWILVAALALLAIGVAVFMFIRRRKAVENRP